jgi:beta-glucosidase
MRIQSKGPTRRELGLGLGGLALAGTAACSSEPQTKPIPKSGQFPANFRWGTATAAFQIEGSQDVDGRSPSVWDIFSQGGQHIADQSTAAVACDSYRRYQEDIDLLAGAGLNSYRFSISWSRVQPDGAGPVNPLGMDYYKRLIDGLLEKGITPFATLYHWDLPQALFEKGGWASRDTANRLADYAALVADHLGDRLKHYMVLNEAAVHMVFGHVLGTEAPGVANGDLIAPVTHHLNLAQGLALQALRAKNSQFKMGSAMALMPIRPANRPWALWNGPVASRFDDMWNGAFLDPLLKGRYPSSVEADMAKVVKQGDLVLTKQPVDFVGVNYYSPAIVQFELFSDAHIGQGAAPKGAEIDAFGRQIDPNALVEILARLRTKYGNPAILISENGCSDPFSATAPAILDDQFRISYLRDHLRAVRVAMEAGSKVDGYFHWTLVDNWEWNLGFTSKFGLVAQDRQTGMRTPKASYAWFKALAASGLIV